jgi:hypothetical protein
MPGALDAVTALAIAWFAEHLTGAPMRQSLGW